MPAWDPKFNEQVIAAIRAERSRPKNEVYKPKKGVHLEKTVLQGYLTADLDPADDPSAPFDQLPSAVTQIHFPDETGALVNSGETVTIYNRSTEKSRDNGEYIQFLLKDGVYYAYDLCCGCDNCNQDPGGTSCCSCVPKEVCYVFQPADDYAGPTIHVFVHDENGHYTPIRIQAGLNEIWIGLELETNEDDECVWRVWTANNEFGISPTQEDETTTDTNNVGCLTDPDSEIEVDPWLHLGVLGVLILHPYLKVPIPKDDNGDPICAGCDCFEECFCLRYTVKYPGGDESSDNVQAQRICWDPTVGDNGGWEYDFPGSDCMPAQTVTLELIDDGTGDCEMVLTDEDNYTQASTTQGTTNCDTGFDALRWAYSPIDPDISTIEYEILDGECLDGCEAPCCQYLPDELNCLIELDDNDPGYLLNGPINLTLTRIGCNSEVYSGSATNLIEWDCEDRLGAPNAGYGDVSVEIRCRGNGQDSAKDCEYDYVDDECTCDCDETDNPAGRGCWLLTDFQLPNFDCYTPADCSNGSAGTLVNKASKCGFFQSTTYLSRCDPLYVMFHAPVGGFGNCLDGWKLTITE